jgi:hypothetical protein
VEVEMIEDEEQASNMREGAWAGPMSKLEVERVPEGITAINIQGRQAIGALQGFGQLWKKTYQVRLVGLQVSASDVMQAWKENFPRFQPEGNRFYPPDEGVEPGKVMFIDSPLPIVPSLYNRPGVVPMTSGVMVLYADDESFSVMTPEGFPVAGWNNFSVLDEEDALVAQVQSFERASDPIYEFGFRFMGGAARQEFIWRHVLTELATHFGLKADVTLARECLDPGIQWSYMKNVWNNAGVRTTLYALAAPIRWMTRPFRKKKSG